MPSLLLAFYWLIILLLATCVNRIVVLPALLRVASRLGVRRRVVLIGDSVIARDFLSRCSSAKDYALIEPIGILTDKDGPLLNTSIPKLGGTSTLPDLVHTHDLAGAIITDPDLSVDSLMRLVEECIALFGWVDVHSSKSAVWQQAELCPDSYFDIPFVRMKAAPESGMAVTYKRIVDVTFSLLGLTLLAPLILLIALLIKLTSPGPVLYSQQRVGENGRPFTFYKFRSMFVGAEDDPSRIQAVIEFMKNDSAVGEKMVNERMLTPFGCVIRKLALDEIPQLWNVLKGDMSLVGPRPLAKNEYDAQDEWQKRRFDIKPGCASLWKIMAVHHSGTSFSNASLYDICYSRNMSPLLDLQILIRTALIVARAKADG